MLRLTAGNGTNELMRTHKLTSCQRRANWEPIEYNIYAMEQTNKKKASDNSSTNWTVAFETRAFAYHTLFYTAHIQHPYECIEYKLQAFHTHNNMEDADR